MKAICWQKRRTGPSWLLISSTVLPAGIPPPSFSSRPPIPTRIRRILSGGLALINLFRLEDCAPQTLGDLRFCFDLDPVFVNDEGMLILRVRGTPHFGNLDFSRAHLHRERILLKRVSLESVLFECRFTANTLFEVVVKPDHSVYNVFLDRLASLVGRLSLSADEQCGASEGFENHGKSLYEASKIDLGQFETHCV